VITNGICAIAVPGFFFISGFLLFSKNFTWTGNMKKKARSILLPYFLVNSFWILFFKIMQSIELTAPYFAGDDYRIIGIEGIIRAYLAPIPLYYPFWFLRDLFILNILASLIRIVIDKFPVLSMIIIIVLCFDIVKIPLLVSNSSFYMFAIGYYAVKYREGIKKLESVNILSAGICFIIFTVCRLCFGGYASLVMPFYSLSGMLFYYALAGYIRKSRTVSKILWCSQFTFFIYAFHEFYEAMIKKVIMMIVPQYGIVQLLEYFILPAVIAGLCIAAGAFMKSRISKLYCLLCGCR
ncbi:MAG: acyltransferase, partial [Lachnospiraceae bacterium]|nr:acyltransferase [Lachnospiraceae bacterium]